MGATSVTGRGYGSADGKNKGSEHMTLGVKHLIGPHIVMAGKGAATATSLVVTVPAAGVATEHVVFANGTDGTARTSAITDNGNGSWTFTVTAGSSGDAIKWMVVKLGL